MAFEYFKYDTGHTNTLVARSNTSFAPLSPPYKEIYYQILIPQTQPLYLYMVSGSTIIPSSQANVDAYLSSSGATAPPTASGNVTYGQYTATTTQTNQNVATVSATTNNKLNTSIFNAYTGTTAPAKYASKANAITGATNLGSGNGTLYTTVSGNKINLKTLSGGTNVTITCNGNYVAINATSGGGINWSGNTVNGIGTYVSGT